MKNFEFHTTQNCPAESRPLLEAAQKNLGFIPNIFAVMAGSPPLLEGYQTLHALAQKTAFNKDELTVVWQTLNVLHQCHYCVPAHTGIAHSMKVDKEIIEALREETPLPTERLESLRQLTQELALERGHLTAATLERFEKAGYSSRHILDVVLILSQKVMSNYVNHLAETPIDEAFESFRWEPNK